MTLAYFVCATSGWLSAAGLDLDQAQAWNAEPSLEGPRGPGFYYRTGTELLL